MENRGYMRRAIVAALVTAFIACFPGGAHVMADTNPTHIAVLMTQDATLVLNGKPATLAQVESAIDAMSKSGGAFWYARENGESEPTAAQNALIQQLFEYVANARLPVRLFTDGTFTTAIGP